MACPTLSEPFNYLPYDNWAASSYVGRSGCELLPSPFRVSFEATQQLVPRRSSSALLWTAPTARLVGIFTRASILLPKEFALSIHRGRRVGRLFQIFRSRRRPWDIGTIFERLQL